MTDLLEKRRILQDAGYRYNFEREVYVNLNQRKVFSLEFLEDRNQTELLQKIAEPNGDGWHFYFTAEPPPGIKRELQKLLGG